PLLAHSLYSDIPSPPPIDTLSLHDALPIFLPQDGPAFQHCRAPAAARAQYRRQAEQPASAGLRYAPARALLHPGFAYAQSSDARSEEHTSELQSRENLVCRLLLEKKK